MISLFIFFLIQIINAQTSGSCGTSCTWNLDTTTGKLTISGSGNMQDFSFNKSPWISSKDIIKTIIKIQPTP